MTQQPTISLCMIVRDEAEMLPDFLAATSGMYDELCVVDTGSDDATPSILAAHGAKVASHLWRDDFAEARNHSLAMASGSWHLVLDADERPDPEAVRAIRAMAAREDIGAATLCMRNVFEHNHTTLSHLLRMFRRDPAIVYQHPIHEDVSDSVMAFLLTSGLGLGQLEGTVDHLGYLRGRMQARGKKALSERILGRSLQDNPNDLYNWFKLCESARFFGDGAKLAEGVAGALAALDGTAPETLLEAHFGGELVALISANRRFDGPEQEHRFLAGWRDKVAPSAALNLRLAETLELMGRADDAAATFRACVDLHAQTSNLQLSSVRPLLGLARLAMAAADLPRALGYVEVALGHNPRDPETLVALTGLCRAMSGEAGLGRIVAAYRDSYGDTPELAQALSALAPPDGGRAASAELS